MTRSCFEMGLALWWVVALSTGCAQSVASRAACEVDAATCDVRADCIADGSAGSQPACECRHGRSGSGTTCGGLGSLAASVGLAPYVCGVRSSGTVDCYGSPPAHRSSTAFWQIDA